MGQRFIWVLFACSCNSSWMPFDPGTFKGCYAVTSAERTFLMRQEAWSRRNIKTPFPNRCSGIFLVESIVGWSKKQDKTSKQTSDHQTDQSGRSKRSLHAVIGETTRRAWRHTFTKSDRRWEGLSTDVNECWPNQRARTTSGNVASMRQPLGGSLW